MRRKRILLLLLALVVLGSIAYLYSLKRDPNDGRSLDTWNRRITED